MNDAVHWVREQGPAMEAALEALVCVNSYTGNAAGGREVAAQLDALFALPGCSREVVTSRRFADHRVYRTSGHGGAPVALIGHLDTVFPPGTFEGYRVDGALRRGPGVLDMKGGLVVIAWALKALSSTRGLGSIAPLRIIIVSDEEVGSPEGAVVIREATQGCSAALVFESGRTNDAIVTRRKGTGTVTARAHGKAAHAGLAYWEGANAIHALSQFVDRAQRLSSRAEDVTVNVGLISGGTAKNTVPALAEATLDLRFPTAQSRQALTAALERAATSTIDGTRLELSFDGGRAPMEKVPGTDELVARYSACACRQALGGDEAPLQGGGSDGNTTASLGIPTIDGLGPRGAHYHTPDEYIEAATLPARAAALVELLTSPSDL